MTFTIYRVPSVAPYPATQFLQRSGFSQWHAFAAAGGRIVSMFFWARSLEAARACVRTDYPDATFSEPTKGSLH